MSREDDISGDGDVDDGNGNGGDDVMEVDHPSSPNTSSATTASPIIVRENAPLSISDSRLFVLALGRLPPLSND